MKKAIVYYSKTGNTKIVAERFSGFDLLRIKAESDNPNILKPVLVETPEVKDYDYLIFASPVHAFSLCRVMVAYLKSLEDLSGKAIDLYVTHQFPFAWLGGNQSLKQMKKIIEAKNGEVRFMTSVNWGSKKREEVIEAMIKQYVNKK
ncbi:MAG: hypothetical protein RQ856_03985 [Candidatus Izemoplasmatales bacterium]|nr:hypothetical protein [Candidatus Izemoplasmatales bacterium]